MTVSPKNNLVPASLQRVRCFLANQGRFKVKPWAGVDETLDALHDALWANQGDDGFWEQLGRLLEELSRDLERRDAGAGGDLIDNEVLGRLHLRQLLDEIRSALATRRKGRGGFRGLATALSAPAAGILVIIGIVATVGTATVAGCYQSELPNAPDGGAQEQAGAGGQLGPGTGGAAGSETSLYGTGTDAAGASGSGGAPSAVPSNPEPPPFTPPPSYTPPPSQTPPPSPTDAGSTLPEIIDTCFPSTTQREQILACVEKLHESWETGLVELFQSSGDCNDIVYHIGCLMGEYDRPPLCDDPERAGEYDRETLLDNCVVAIYEGVRFE